MDQALYFKQRKYFYMLARYLLNSNYGTGIDQSCAYKVVKTGLDNHQPDRPKPQKD